MLSQVVARIRSDQWRILRDVRLRALEDAPYAFGTTLSEGEQRTDRDWQDMARDHANLSDRAYFMAYVGDNPCGMAGCYRRASDVVVLTAMWVAPEFRGQNIGEQIVSAVIEWAREGGATTLEAWVSENNLARFFYQKIGFEETSLTEPLRSDSKIQIILLRRDIVA
ncbi:MAG: GNAT family N-acetyltransferase [Gemmatimonadetes bacterium]|nr:GNAT family N-acetyltransferase [Gemmatimonadota bacterium]